MCKNQDYQSVVQSYLSLKLHIVACQIDKENILEYIYFKYMLGDGVASHLALILGGCLSY